MTAPVYLDVAPQRGVPRKRVFSSSLALRESYNRACGAHHPLPPRVPRWRFGLVCWPPTADPRTATPTSSTLPAFTLATATLFGRDAAPAQQRRTTRPIPLRCMQPVLSRAQHGPRSTLQE